MQVEQDWRRLQAYELAKADVQKFRLGEVEQL